MLWVVCYPPPPTLEKPTTFFFSLQAAAEVHTIQWKLSRKSSKACYFSTPLCTLPILYYTLSDYLMNNPSEEEGEVEARNSN